MTQVLTKEKPILFNTEMVRAVLAGNKTQTRRVVKPQPDNIRETVFCESGLEDTHGYPFKNPYGVVGDRLWVRETFWIYTKTKVKTKDLREVGKNWIFYQTDDTSHIKNIKWRPSIFMRRWASRITLEIIDIRVEQLQDITLEAAIAEGFGDVREFNELFLKLNSELKDKNPWVWVVEFKLVENA